MNKSKELSLWRKRKIQMIEMRKKGSTYTEIGKFFNISRQRVNQILEAPTGSLRKMNVKERDDYSCQVCGSFEDLRVHHKDKNPLNNKMENLITLCDACHKKLHKEERKA